LIKFTIPFRLPSLNEYINKINRNRHAGNRFKQETEDQIIWILKGLKQRIQRPVNIKFIWYEQTKRRDKDNVMSAKKFIFDALQKSGILPNDNNKYINSITEEIIYRQGDKVEVEIWEA
jgi:Holliday junction resolvase RusA-like endonuclease